MKNSKHFIKAVVNSIIIITGIGIPVIYHTYKENKKLLK